MKRKDSAVNETGKVMWHSLNKNGEIEIYDVKWPNGKIQANIPVSMLEGVREIKHVKESEKHGVQEASTQIEKRNYKNKS